MIIQDLDIRGSTKKAHASLVRTCIKIAKRHHFSCLSVPDELQLCIAMVSFVFDHKITTLPNFISAMKRHFQFQGILPRNLLCRKVQKGLFQIFGTFDVVVHKVPIRLKNLILLILFFLSQKKYMFAFAIALNCWAALRISELLRVRWSDLLFCVKSTAVVVRRAKNHSSPKISFVSHSSGVDNLMSLALLLKLSLKTFQFKVPKRCSLFQETPTTKLSRLPASPSVFPRARLILFVLVLLPTPLATAFLTP